MENLSCKKCGRENLTKDDFYSQVMSSRKGDRIYFRKECRKCTDKKTVQCRGLNRYRDLFENCRKTCRRLQIVLELTREDVKTMIDNPCHYCGEEDREKMGIDRVENHIGYTRKNSVPCCIRCNAMKRDMPIRAWNILVPKIREAKELGLFGTWTPHPTGKIGPVRSASGRPN